jgi:hypothetical protein
VWMARLLQVQDLDVRPHVARAAGAVAAHLPRWCDAVRDLDLLALARARSVSSRRSFRQDVALCRVVVPEVSAWPVAGMVAVLEVLEVRASRLVVEGCVRECRTCESASDAWSWLVQLYVWGCARAS